MKTQFSSQQDTGSRSTRLFAFCLGLAGLVGLVLLGFTLYCLRLAPAESLGDRRLPANQLQADARTLAAAVRFLVASDNEAGASGPASTSRPLPAELPHGLPQIALSGDSSNGPQIRMEPFTNRASRI
jgi:hypothetical protein